MEDKKEKEVVKKTRTARRSVEKVEETPKKIVKKTTVDKEIKKEEKPVEIKKEVKKEPEVKEEIKIKEVIVEKNNGFNYAEVIVIMIITLILGGVCGSFLTYITKGNKQIVRTIVNNNGSSQKLPSEFNEFLQTYENIVNNYYEDVDSKKLIEAGISGMLEYLGDDYSVYMDQEISQEFTEQVEGKYKGIGVEIVLTDAGVVVNRVFADSPAAKAGIEPGDLFVSVDGEDVKEKTPSDISEMIRGSKTGNVIVVVKRKEEEKTFELKLKEVNIESVTSEIIEKDKKKIGYIGLSIFASNTYDQFKKKLEDLESKGIDSLIIDVRSNTGGYLTSVTSISSLFLDKSKIIYQLDTKGIVEQVYSSTKEKRDYKIVVLINEGSASASEILAAALQESYGATLVGKNTFGKGTVQTAYQLESGATVKYTIQKWLTPKGNWINKVGVKPDVEVELSEEYFKNPSKETDNQLQKAIEELSK